jgi:hypothetical protein
LFLKGITIYTTKVQLLSSLLPKMTISLLGRLLLPLLPQNQMIQPKGKSVENQEKVVPANTDKPSTSNSVGNNTKLNTTVNNNKTCEPKSSQTMNNPNTCPRL